MADQPTQPTTPVQPSGSTWMPTRKWNASTFSGALAILIVWGIHATHPDVHIPAEIGMAFSTVISGLVAYFVPNANGQS